MSIRELTRELQRRLGVVEDGIYGEVTAKAALAVIPAPVQGVRSPTALAEPDRFFGAVRAAFGPLKQPQVDGFNFLLLKMGLAGWGVAWTAYGLATAWHETANRMQPVREGLDVSDEWRRTHLRYYPWYGRGYPQTTWDYNYRNADEKLGLSGTLIADPDRMLEPEIAAATMVRGMEEGWFTRKKLADYLPATGLARREHFVEARRIINGTDRADKIALEAMKFQSALARGGWR